MENKECTCAQAGFPNSCDNCDAPVAWVIPGDNNARDNGFIDAMAWQEGEFTRPLYGLPVQSIVKPALDRFHLADLLLCHGEFGTNLSASKDGALRCADAVLKAFHNAGGSSVERS